MFKLIITTKKYIMLPNNIKLKIFLKILIKIFIKKKLNKEYRYHILNNNYYL